MIRDLLVATLEQAGYSMLAASEGLEALRVCERYEGPIDLLATDVVMPGMSGRELARQARCLRQGMSVLYLTGYADATVAREAAGESGARFLEKPFEMKDLVREVREMLAEREQGQG